MTVRVALLLVGVLVAACERKSATHQASVVRPLMWSVEKDGQTSYLLGTMHVGVDPGRLPAYVWDTLDTARTLAVETDVSGSAPLLLRTDGRSLRDELGPGYWKKLEDTLGVDAASKLTTFKPTGVAASISSRGFPRTASIDHALKTRASERGKSIIYLEKVEAQFAVLDKWLDTRALREMLDDLGAIEQISAQMLAAYVAGDAAQILAVNARERERLLARGRTQAECDELMEDILYRRNASWIEPIERLHREGSGFIAVGAAHLVGPRSVVELLEQRGYKVTRITRPSN